LGVNLTEYYKAFSLYSDSSEIAPKKNTGNSSDPPCL
jgi:hypothetical protein